MIKLTSSQKVRKDYYTPNQKGSIKKILFQTNKSLSLKEMSI